jgi:hypothetical protein
MMRSNRLALLVACALVAAAPMHHQRLDPVTPAPLPRLNAKDRVARAEAKRARKAQIRRNGGKS